MRWALVLVAILLGCTYPQYEFIVLRDVPESPSFVVLPVNDRRGQVEFANQIETMIIGCNVKVVNRPSKKDVTRAVGQGVLGLEAEKNRVVQGDAGYQVIESYPAYHEFDADYVVLTYAESKRVRIIKRETDEVLASIEMKGYARQTTKNKPESESAYYRRRIATALGKMGIPVNKNIR